MTLAGMSRPFLQCGQQAYVNTNQTINPLSSSFHLLMTILSSLFMMVAQEA